MNFFKNKSILIIGGTGTIGRGLIKELVKHNPKVIRIFSRDEDKQFNMQQHWNVIKEYNNFRFLIGDVRDYERVERAMGGIDIVFNLSAMKHVASCEYNPTEAIKTNIDGINNVIKAATKHNIEAVIFTSSDKAINPTNTYGATKMLAEKLVQAANYSKGSIKTRFLAVRFGNVIGSRGSVIPLFKKQILEQEKITVTDLNMNRFMMTVDQAVNLMIKALKIGVGGEVFVLKMPVVKLKDLAHIVIEETCIKYKRNKKIKTEIIGLRPGERLYEELMTELESYSAYDLDDMYAVMPTTFSISQYKEIDLSERKVSIGSYSSWNETTISEEELRKLIIEENLI